MLISPRQCTAARGLLGWTQDQLAKASLCGRATVAAFEQGKRTPHERTIRDIKVALQEAGIDFIEAGEVSPDGGRGVRCHSSD
ncbi:helix-turn-helix transcriptional regulator [Bosea thiooxidans]